MAEQSAVRSNSAFSTALYQTLSSKPGNLVISPLSVETVLAMALVGAEGKTKKELATSLHLPNDRSAVEKHFNQLLGSLKSMGDIILDIANKIYIQQGKNPKNGYLQAIKDNFHSEVEEVDFDNKTEEARARINQWVEEKTHNMIQNLIQEGMLNKMSLMVAVNAVYFKSGWLKPFCEEYSCTEPFYTTRNSTVNVTMMHECDEFEYREVKSLDIKVLVLPYYGGEENREKEEYSMILLLPKKRDGLKKLEAKIRTVNLMDITTKNMKFVETNITLPRFKIETTLSLVDLLKQMGITRIFQRGAELSGITDEDVYLSEVLQKAFIGVTEKGTEAGAATYTGMVFCSSPRTIKEFKADHPFLFMITEQRSGTILFMGRVTNPTTV